jgi:hypothetical protein
MADHAAGNRTNDRAGNGAGRSLRCSVCFVRTRGPVTDVTLTTRAYSSALSGVPAEVGTVPSADEPFCEGDDRSGAAGCCESDPDSSSATVASCDGAVVDGCAAALGPDVGICDLSPQAASSATRPHNTQ